MTRGEYALWECGDCGIQLAANEMTPVTDQVLATTRRSNRVYRGTRGGLGIGTSGSNTYRIEHKQVCPDCLALRIERIERRRREARARLIGAVVFVGILIAIAIGVAHFTSAPSATANPADARAGNVPAGPSPDNTAAAPAVSTEEAFASAANNGDATLSTPVAQEGAPRPAPIAETETSSQAQDTVSDHHDEEAAILAAAPKALESGQPEPWRAAGKSGYVVVSSPQAYQNRTCRNVYATIIKGREQTQSTPHQWCQPNGGGEWAPVPVSG